MKQPVTVPGLREFKRSGEKIVSLTAYDATLAKVLEAAGVEVILVGDSLGTVIQGHATTIPVTLADMIYHIACVHRGVSRALVVGDLPFASYVTPQQAVASGAELIRAGAQMVKLEGGHSRLDAIRALVAEGIPVCGHLGLLPQSIHRLGRYQVQGTEPQAAQRLLEEACLLEEAGIDLLVLECIPATLAEAITAEVTVPTIGIGAGPHCDGQVLVLYDLLGLWPGERPPRFVQNFLAGSDGIEVAVRAYVAAVKSGRFPSEDQSY